MTHIPKFEDIFTETWLKDCLDDGSWDPEHGSDVVRLIYDLQNGEPWLPKCPNGMENASYDECAASEEFRAAIMEWARARYQRIVKQIQKRDEYTIARRMSVDENWHSKLSQGKATLGIYFGEIPLDSGGGFWTDIEKPVSIYIEVKAKPQDIDWEGTLKARMDYATGDEECEIRLNHDVSVELVRLEVDDQEDEMLVGRFFNTGEPFEIEFDNDTIETPIARVK